MRPLTTLTILRLRAVVSAFALLSFAPLLACTSPPATADLPEWTPADHDRSEEKERVASGTQAAAVGSGSKEDSLRLLVETTWRNQCASCHGPVGRGDGPNGPMVKATDLTQPDWQSSRADAEIAAVIARGKGKMPRFDLPPNVVNGLVARIRLSRGR